VSVPVQVLGLPDRFVEHGDPAKLLACAGWTRPASKSPSAAFWAAADPGGVNPALAAPERPIQPF
jgi:hypothetical protein